MSAERPFKRRSRCCQRAEDIPATCHDLSILLRMLVRHSLTVSVHAALLSILFRCHASRLPTQRICTLTALADMQWNMSILRMDQCAQLS